MSQSIFCCVCNTKAGVTPRNATNIFTEFVNTSSRQTMASLLSEILDKTLTEGSLHSNVICKKCQKICTEYESIKIRSQAIKTELVEQFKVTLTKHNKSYETYDSNTSAKSPVKSGNTPKKGGKIVLPASKLQPLPSDYVIDMSKWTGSQKFKKIGLMPKNVAITSAESSTSNVKTVSPSVQTQNNIKTEQTASCQDESNILENSITTILNTQTTNSVLSFNVNMLKKDILNSSMVMSKLDDGNAKKDSEDLGDNDDEAMEIESDCTLVRVTSVNDLNLDENEHTYKDNSSDKSQYIEMPLGEKERDRILGKLVLNREGNVDGQTIVMTEEDGDILRVVSGQKLVYENGEISIVDDDDDNSNQDDDYNEGDGHDSNDESQIELQVSGDEETANAIIAAAQEQGGAFIKVESGEMYRVKSVQSKTAEVNTEAQLRLVSEENGEYKCLLCENGDPLSEPATGDAQVIMEHLKSAHDARIYICNVCKKVVRKRTDYMRHMEEHNMPGNDTASTDKSRVHECSVCKKKYNSRTLLMEHMNVHSGSKPYTCTICNKSFSSKYTLVAHHKTHAERPRPFKCTECPKKFLTLQNLSQHLKTHSGIKDFICEVCNKAFGTQHNLEVHSIVHTGNKPFVCGVCGKAFARRAEVKDHMRIHTGERPFACDICGATFTQRSNLHSHKRATHMNDKRYHCTQCPKRFKRRRLLDYHVQGSHTGERPLQCEICHATFVYPEHYKKHIRIHSGEKPYICEVCGKSFNSRDNRNTHRFTHSDKKPYECLVCGAGFMRKQLLYAHMNSAGHIAESIVVNQPRVQKVSTINVDAIKATDKLQTIFETAQGDLEIDAGEANPGAPSEAAKFFTSEKRYILQDDKLSLTQDGDEGTFLSLQPLDGGKSEPTTAGMLFQSITAADLGDQTEVVASDDKGEMVRLVQIQLEDGNSGWMAIAQ